VEVYLIVGLGNPGKAYEKTRHNIGFETVKLLAEMWGVAFSRQSKLKSYVAQKKSEERTIFLLMPDTYMNNSGIAVRAAMDYYKVPLENILIVVDDVAIDFAEFRLRKDSGTGGHNGLKSIEEHLNTDAYARLRFGVANNNCGDLADYVTAKFSQEEEKLLPELLKQAVYFIEKWLSCGLEKAMNEANVKKRG